jgi:transcriptional regulator GlxA family with amidase domain
MLANLGDETLCVKDLANVAHVSERALQLTWRKYVGESPATHIRRLRLERIRHDLVSSMRDVADIAKSWGMPSRGALNVAFRQAYGVSPMQVRRP